MAQWISGVAEETPSIKLGSRPLVIQRRLDSSPERSWSVDSPTEGVVVCDPTTRRLSLCRSRARGSFRSSVVALPSLPASILRIEEEVGRCRRSSGNETESAPFDGKGLDFFTRFSRSKPTRFVRTRPPPTGSGGHREPWGSAPPSLLSDMWPC